MSFGSEVKKELMNIDLNNVSEERALVMAILHNSSELTASTENSKFEWKLAVRSTILSVIKFVAKFLKKHYNCSDQFKTKEKNNLNKFRYFYLELSNVEEVIKDFHLLDYHLENVTTDFLGLNDLELQNVYLRGLFITHGSISDPRMSTYHFEIATSHEQLAYLMKTIFENNGINALLLERTHKRADSTYLVYIKRSEDISSALVALGATQGMFNFEDQRIYRDFKNMANRVTNCDIANERKCIETAKKQLAAIKFIRDNNKFDEMSVRLQSICILREMYPESSNEELAEFSSNVFGKELSKSGISHCFKSLMDYYKNLLKEI